MLAIKLDFWATFFATWFQADQKLGGKKLMQNGDFTAKIVLL